jgi:hypothetical protein
MNNKSLRFNFTTTILLCLRKFFGEHFAHFTGFEFR